MSVSRKRLWSYAAALFLAGLTLFVFYVLRDFGPESTARRFNALGNRLVRYIPDTVPMRLDLLRPAEAAELSRITVNFPNDDKLVPFLNQLRVMAYAHASFEVVRVDYKTPSLAIVVGQYTLPIEATNRTGFVLWIMEYKQNAWRINAKRTQDTADNMLPM